MLPGVSQGICKTLGRLFPLNGLLICHLLIPLRLFKFGKVKNDLVSRKALALKKWGIIRLFLLGAPLLLDTLLYYTYMKATFGYLALILVLCLPFVYPSMDRCLTETEEESETEVKSETEVEP